jgi:hypothetical protein
MLTALEVTLLLLAASILSVLLLRRLGMPPLVAYLLVGVVLGPFAANLSASSDAMHNLAELGVVFLMFTLGLEFNLPKLRSMRHLVFGLGLSQVALTMAVTLAGHFLLVWAYATLLGGRWEMPWRGAVVLSLPRKLALLAAAAVSVALASTPPFNATTLNHFCVVTRDFNATANAYSWLFGAAPPVGAISEHSWLWYRGANTTAKALLVHAPGGPAGFNSPGVIL